MGGPPRTRCGRGPSWFWTATCIESSTATDGSRGSAPVFRGRSNLVVEWPRAGRSLASRPRKYVGERRVAGEKSGLENTIRQGLERAARHMDSCSAVSRHLVVFDLGPDKARGEPVVRRDAEPGLGKVAGTWNHPPRSRQRPPTTDRFKTANKDPSSSSISSVACLLGWRIVVIRTARPHQNNTRGNGGR